MQIDFHHAVTYVVARLAGFDASRAQIIAHCAQYVDDATNGGEIQFDVGAYYSRLATAHRTLDYRNFEQLASHRVWLPFHFLPGNGGRPAGEAPAGSFIHKLVCRPNSPVAQDMVRAAIQDQDTPWSLHRLGITAHVFVDTWAHQGFAGVTHPINNAQDIRVRGEPAKELAEKVANFFANSGILPPLGHGKVLSYPDQPFLVWSYKNGLGETVHRDNVKDFLDAADQLCQAFQRYLVRDPDAQVPGLPHPDRAAIKERFQTYTEKDGEARHARWLQDIARGAFSFGPESVAYRAKGLGSPKHFALGTEKDHDSSDDIFPFKPEFLTSDWKMFHDAAKLHRLVVLDQILPRYQIISA